MKIDLQFDQSLFVRAALQGVVREAAIAASLTALMILLFLGSWRSTLIVAISIPLSILTSIIVLKFLGQTLNTMTLGGLGLAVGILVDDATVEIENIHRNLGQGKEIEPAILDGAAQIAVPAFVSTLAICIVFVPVVFLSGAAKSLFTPLGMAVVFAMMASYLLSRTLVPTMVKFLLASEVEMYQEHEPGEEHAAPKNANWIWRTHFRFNAAFERFRARYQEVLDWVLGHAGFTMGCFALFHCALGLSAAIYRTGLLSGCGCGNVPAACANGSGNAYRRGGADLQPGGCDDSRDGSRRKSWDWCWMTSGFRQVASILLLATAV